MIFEFLLSMVNLIIIILGKLLSKIFKALNLGNGSTWPGHIALAINKNFIKELLGESGGKIILIAGTNGKTTTALMIKNILKNSGHTVMHNESGANLISGLASSIIQNCTYYAKLNKDYIVFETDENALPQVLENIIPHYIILLNLFRDQLDRYGEIHTIIYKWKSALQKLPSSTMLLLNADDPQISYLSLDSKLNAQYFGLNTGSQKKTTSEADSVFCPACGKNLVFHSLSFAHLGNWQCGSCGLHRPSINLDSIKKFPLNGIYNKYNALAAALLAKNLKIRNEIIDNTFDKFEPAFGRQEIIIFKNTKTQIFLSKNPTGFNQSFETIKDLKGKNILFVLNDRIPDGRDISWIWDTDLSGITAFKNIFVSGDRCFDIGLRIKYESISQKPFFEVIPDLEKAITQGIDSINKNETLYIMPTYSAMLEVRKILTGKKIL